MKKTFLVARREYCTTVRRKGFIIATLGFPLILALMYLVIGGSAIFTARQLHEKLDTIGLVDESGILQTQLLSRVEHLEDSAGRGLESVPPMFRDRAMAEAKKLSGNVSLVPFRTRDEAHAAYIRKAIRGYYLVPSDYIQRGVILLEIKKGAFMSDSSPGWDIVRKLTSASLVEGRLQAEIATRLWIPASLQIQALDDQGLHDRRGQFAEITGFVVPYIFAIFFLISIMSSAGYLMQTVAEEKENRVIEVLISSVRPEELLSGKIIGLCGAGLTQVLVWTAIGVVPAVFIFPFLELRWDQLLSAVIFFTLGFFLFGSLMGSTASLGNNFRESQQASMVWSLSSVIPMFVMPAIFSQPNGAVARVLSFIPLTAPMTMMMRAGAARVAWWEIALSALVMIVSLFFVLKLTAKLFRIGTLMYGKRPSLVEIVRWMRAA